MTDTPQPGTIAGELSFALTLNCDVLSQQHADAPGSFSPQETETLHDLLDYMRDLASSAQELGYFYATVHALLTASPWFAQNVFSAIVATMIESKAITLADQEASLTDADLRARALILPTSGGN